MLVVWRDSAIDDLERIDSWLSSIESADPSTVRQRIGATARTLERLGDIGRPGRVAGTRELPVRKAPYVIIYQVKLDTIEVVGVFHMAQNR